MSDNTLQQTLKYVVDEIESAPVNLELLAERLKVLAGPKRLHIFNLLMEGVQGNCEIGAPLACKEGAKDSWREAAHWAAGQSKVRFADDVEVK